MLLESTAKQDQGRENLVYTYLSTNVFRTIRKKKQQLFYNCIKTVQNYTSTSSTHTKAIGYTAGVLYE